MKIKNFKIKKAVLAISFSCLVAGCNNYNGKEIVVNKEPVEQNNDIENIDLNTEYLDKKIKLDELIYIENMYTKTNLNLRESNSTDSNIIIVIEKCQKLMEIENLGDWSYIKYGDKLGYVKNCYINDLPDSYIEVDISDQNIKYHTNEEIILDSNIVTGMQNVSDTRIGMFEIYSKQTSRYLTGPGYRSYVDYWMPFDGGIGLHDASWRDEFGGEIYINSGSHGCVNLPFEIAKKIYDNSEIGTKVLVHK